MGKKATSSITNTAIGSAFSTVAGGPLAAVIGGLDIGGIATKIKGAIQPPKPGLPQDPNGTTQGSAKLADSAVYGSAYSQQLSQRLAASAGGTLFARASQTPLGNDANGQRKSLLGA